MKKRTILVMAFAAMLAVSCKSVERLDPSLPVTTALYYSVDGGEYQGAASGYNSDNELIQAMLDIAREGHTIVIAPNKENAMLYNSNPIVFKTKSREEAFQWVKRLSRRGYRVIVSYNTSRKVYICTAVVPKE